MTTVAVVDAQRVGGSGRGELGGLDLLVATVRRREVVIVVRGVDGVAAVLDTLRTRMPRFRFVPLLVAGRVAFDWTLVQRLLDDGDVPLVAVDPLAVRRAVGEAVRLLRPSNILQLNVVTAGSRPHSGDVRGEPIPQRLPGSLHDHPGGWCTRPAQQFCPRTAAIGCSGCPAWSYHPN
ncbi:hypothetical protein [Dactylosporangium matsuzakiense]|uniref:Uncharacterized protein n=1 Tax=Dactylosporangium matsuzakiense TaxID=53360 RepID=A0A9W6KSS0_9ACTN|nr:hypothetical protein [Dactylosporangium matsuzakiense]UWZ41378.1 hypothetical protein Dmats_27315 [Dactylosporangium matsuzakiense]GLL06480.1 hypothetical protein GCM10017581_082300 [Dactylosporangium matsuzakiense]